MEERVVYIVSFAPWGDADAGIGGFDHFPADYALTAFLWYMRLENTSTRTHRVRLIRDTVPADLSPEEVTSLIDDNLDYFEVEADAILDTHWAPE